MPFHQFEIFSVNLSNEWTKWMHFRLPSIWWPFPVFSSIYTCCWTVQTQFIIWGYIIWLVINSIQLINFKIQSILGSWRPNVLMWNSAADFHVPSSTRRLPKTESTVHNSTTHNGFGICPHHRHCTWICIFSGIQHCIQQLWQGQSNLNSFYWFIQHSQMIDATGAEEQWQEAIYNLLMISFCVLSLVYIWQR